MSLRNLWKPQWQSDHIIKRNKALKKLTKEKDIYAAILYYHHHGRIFVDLFKRLKDSEHIEEMALFYLTKCLNYPKQKGSDLPGYLYGIQDVCMVLAKKNMIADTISRLEVKERIEAVYLFSELDAMDYHWNEELSYIKEHANVLEIKIWAELKMNWNRLPAAFFSASDVFQVYIAENHPNKKLFDENYDQFSDEIKQIIIKYEGNRAFRIKKAVAADKVAVSALILNEILEVIEKREEGDRTELLNKLKSYRTHGVHPKRLNDCCEKLFKITSNLEEKMICYENLNENTALKYKSEYDEAKKLYTQQKKKAQQKLAQQKLEERKKKLIEQLNACDSITDLAKQGDCMFNLWKYEEHPALKKIAKDKIYAFDEAIDERIMDVNRPLTERKSYFSFYIFETNKKEEVYFHLLKEIVFSDDFDQSKKVDELIWDCLRFANKEDMHSDPKLKDKIKSIYYKTDDRLNIHLYLLPFMGDKQIRDYYDKLGNFEKRYQLLNKIEGEQKKQLRDQFVATYPDWEDRLKKIEKDREEQKRIDRMRERGEENWLNMK